MGRSHRFYPLNYRVEWGRLDLNQHRACYERAVLTFELRTRKEVAPLHFAVLLLTGGLRFSQNRIFGMNSACLRTNKGIGQVRKWSIGTELNRQPPVYKTGVLPLNYRCFINEHLRLVANKRLSTPLA